MTITKIVSIVVVGLMVLGVAYFLYKAHQESKLKQEVKNLPEPKPKKKKKSPPQVDSPSLEKSEVRKNEQVQEVPQEENITGTETKEEIVHENQALENLEQNEKNVDLEAIKDTEVEVNSSG